MLIIRQNVFYLCSVVIFVSGALLHGFRAYYGFPMVYGSWLVPTWVSWLGTLVGFLMALAALRHLR